MPSILKCVPVGKSTDVTMSGTVETGSGIISQNSLPTLGSFDAMAAAGAGLMLDAAQLTRPPSARQAKNNFARMDEPPGDLPALFSGNYRERARTRSVWG